MIVEPSIDIPSYYLVVVDLECAAACDYGYFTPYEVFQELERVVEPRHLGVTCHNINKKFFIPVHPLVKLI